MAVVSVVAASLAVVSVAASAAAMGLPRWDNGSALLAGRRKANPISSQAHRPGCVSHALCTRRPPLRLVPPPDGVR